MDRVVLILSNDGYGLPNERFQHYLAEPAGTESQEIREIRDGIERVRRWQGEVEARADLGTGYSFTIFLAKVR